VKIIRNAGDPPKRKISDEAYERKEYSKLDPRAKKIYDAIPGLNSGDAIDIEGDLKALARIAGAMVKRSNRYQGTPVFKVRCETRSPDKVRIYFK
jgi:hypothetical protein